MGRCPQRRIPRRRHRPHDHQLGDHRQHCWGICSPHHARQIEDTVRPTATEHGTDGVIACVSSSPTITSCTIKNNSASTGGGIYTYESNAVILNCAISENQAEYGAGLYFWDYTPSVYGCTVTGNTAGNHGGGFCCVYGSAAITNCTLTENTAITGAGGAVYCFKSGPTLLNCTVALNQATVGGGVRCASSSNPVITNCILWDDTPNELSVQSSTPAVTYTDIEGGWAGTGNINLEPKFVAGYYLSQVAAGQIENSPCVDAGNPASAMITGTTRTDGVQDADPVDMGYHYQAAAVHPGDLNCDDVVDFNDINPFVMALADPGGYHQAYPNCNILNGDCDLDGDVDFDDINPFVALLMGD